MQKLIKKLKEENILLKNRIKKAIEILGNDLYYDENFGFIYWEELIEYLKGNDNILHSLEKDSE